VVLKLGGELLEQPADVQRIARGIRALARRASLTIVHGGRQGDRRGAGARGYPEAPGGRAGG
jgi:acetylglutamate kinase